MLVGLDIGTTGARAVAIDLAGRVVTAASAEYPLLTPRPGWTEQDPEDWWAATRAVLGEVCAQIREPVLGLGLTGQMHGAVFLDAGDQVIRPAILWNDQRTAAQCAEITDRIGRARLIEITGNPAVTGFQAPKLLWLRDQEPAAYARVRHLLLPKDYVRLRLTGEFATDASDASGTLLLDLRTRTWSPEVLDALDIPRGWLPEVFEGPDVTGFVSRRAAAETGLPEGLSVAAGGGDNAAAAVGSGIVTEGLVSCSIGTSGVIFAPSDTPRVDPGGRLHAFCHAVPGAYHLMGVTLAAGGSLRWWRDLLANDLDYDGLTSLAAQAPPGSEGLLFLPYLAGERTPHLDSLARGAFIGLGLRHSLAHLTRAVMEGVCYSLKDSLDLMSAQGLPIQQIRATGGGAASPVWRQMQSDVFGLPIFRTTIDEGAAYGAALLAGVATRFYAAVSDACGVVRVGSEVNNPNPAQRLLYSRYHEVFARAYDAAAPIMHELAELAPMFTDSTLGRI